ncbi:MAG: hypothetical protein R2851_10315 [Caldilineaceae bacterium]
MPALEQAWQQLPPPSGAANLTAAAGWSPSPWPLNPTAGGWLPAPRPACGR